MRQSTLSSAVKRLAVSVCFAALVSLAAITLLADFLDDDMLRTQVRYNAEQWGVVLTNVWTRVDSERHLVIFGGTLGSTQELYRLFLSLTNFPPALTRVQQTIETPQPSPYPQWFAIGYDPYKKEEGQGTRK